MSAPSYNLGPLLDERVRTVLEFHRWGGSPECVTGGGTIYAGLYARLRNETLELESLCAEIARHCRGRLPEPAATLAAAGRMYRRGADFVKAREYFLRALESLNLPPAEEGTA